MSPRTRHRLPLGCEPPAPAHALRHRLVGSCLLVACISGCGLFGGGQQTKQLQAENDRLLAEYRAQRDRLSKLQETNAALEARVGEAERLLAQTGQSLPSSRISRAPRRSTPSSSVSATPVSNSPPPYVPPTVPSLHDATTSDQSGPVKWRPLRRP